MLTISNKEKRPPNSLSMRNIRQRRILKAKFVDDHKELWEKAGGKNIPTKDWMHDVKQQEIALLARKELNYATTTYTWDILYGLKRNYYG